MLRGYTTQLCCTLINAQQQKIYQWRKQQTQATIGEWGDGGWWRVVGQRHIRCVLLRAVKTRVEMKGLRRGEKESFLRNMYYQ